MSRSARRSSPGSTPPCSAERERFRTTLASIGDAVIATDTEGLVSYLNPVALAMTGWSEADALGTPLQAVFTIIDENARSRPTTPRHA